jgi:transposase
MIEVRVMIKPIRPNIVKGAVYPPEFREEAVRYWLSSGQTLAAVCSDLGLTPECVRSWRRQMEATQTPVVISGDTTVSSPSNELALAREIGQLRQELEAMTRQRDILKKAISIFSDDKTLNGSLSNGGSK